MKHIEELEVAADVACEAMEVMAGYAPVLFYDPRSPFARVRHAVNEMRRALEDYPYGS